MTRPDKQTTPRPQRQDGRPDDRTLFALYHLGLDPVGRYRFRNLHECAKAVGTDTATLQQWLEDARIDQDTASRVDFNVTKWHVEAQFVAPADAPALIDRAWTGYQHALRDRGTGDFRHDVDYDDIWGDGKPPED
jgi:hypothetical protein